MTERRPVASVYLSGDTAPFIVGETPLEMFAMVQEAEKEDTPDWLELTLANPDSRWNGRTLYLRGDAISAVGPPMTGDE